MVDLEGRPCVERSRHKNMNLEDYKYMARVAGIPDSL